MSAVSPWWQYHSPQCKACLTRVLWACQQGNGVLVGMFDNDVASHPVVQAGTVRATAMLLLDMVQLHSQPTDFHIQSAAAPGPRKIAACVSIHKRTAFAVSVIVQA